MKPVFIYALSCPITGQVRYIGKSVSPIRRFRAHLKAPENCRRTNWIRSLSAKGLEPILEILAQVPDYECQQWEIDYIAAFRSLGFDLVNGTLGGEGGSPMLGKKHTPETRAKMRIAKLGKNLGKKLSPEHRDKIRAAGIGRKFAAESRAKISAALTGIKRSTETREKLRVAHLGKPAWNKGMKNGKRN